MTHCQPNANQRIDVAVSRRMDFWITPVLPTITIAAPFGLHVFASRLPQDGMD